MKKIKKKKAKDKDNNNLEFVVPHDKETGSGASKNRPNEKTGCIKCGNCCTGGTPVLLKEDLPLFMSGALSYDSVYAVREGEIVRAYGRGEPYESSRELIKLREKEGAAECVFFKGDAGCGIYENRPAQCRIYKCWALDENLTGLEEKRLTRKELLNSIETILQVIERHEEKCSYRRLSGAVERLAKGGDDAVEDIVEILQYDTYARPFLEEKFNIPSGAMDLILGRPLINTINEFGIKVEKQGEEYILSPVKEVK